MDEERYWSMIDAAWDDGAPALASQRARLEANEASDDDLDALEEGMEGVVNFLATSLALLNKEDLLAFDRILEEKLYEIDRAEIQEHTDGSDDGFLYARGFIVGMGRSYYETVDDEPARAVTDRECERMCYLSMHVFENLFGKMPRSDISRETGSNEAAW